MKQQSNACNLFPYHSFLHTTHHMQKYNNSIIFTSWCNSPSNHLWKWINWMHIQCELWLTHIQCEYNVNWFASNAHYFHSVNTPIYTNYQLSTFSLNMYNQVKAMLGWQCYSTAPGNHQRQAVILDSNRRPHNYPLYWPLLNHHHNVPYTHHY